MSAFAFPRARRDAWRDVAVALPPDFALASGDRLHDGHVALRRYGDADAPQIVVLGGISAGRSVGGAGGWWTEIVGESRAIDTDAFGVIGVDFAPRNDERVRISPRDQARLLAFALDRLNIPRLHALVGASYGAMVSLALAERAPERVSRLVIIAASHKPSALGLAWRGVQRRIVEFGLSKGEGAKALSLARQLAMTTYRGPAEFEARFGVELDGGGQGEVDRYLIARGAAYPEIVPPRRWLSLSEAIDRHDVDPAQIATPTTLAACPSDQLVPFSDVEDLARRLPKLRGLHTLHSIYGHDAFLKETDALAPIISAALEADAHDTI
jgi:homoserine O-acetyltransferase